MIISYCRQTKRSRPVQKSVTVLGPARLVKAGSRVTTPVIQPISHAQMEHELVLSIRRSRRQREREAAQMLAEFSRSEPASVSSVRRR